MSCPADSLCAEWIIVAYLSNVKKKSVELIISIKREKNCGGPFLSRGECEKQSQDKATWTCQLLNPWRTPMRRRCYFKEQQTENKQSLQIVQLVANLNMKEVSRTQTWR
ncbi:unnamed protein product [Eretmochelys imbricata]